MRTDFPLRVSFSQVKAASKEHVLEGALMKRARKKLLGQVTKIVKSNIAEPEKAQIELAGAENLYREIRIENKLTTDSGTDVSFKAGRES